MLLNIATNVYTCKGILRRYFEEDVSYEAYEEAWGSAELVQICRSVGVINGQTK